MAKAKARRRSQSMTVPVAVIAGFAPLVFQTYRSYTENGLDGASQALVALTTGYSRWEGKWVPQYMLKGLGPIVAGVLVHKLAGRIGINRALANAGIPLLRI